MALPLPQQPNDLRVVLPPNPQHPPSLSDINEAMKYKCYVIDSFNANASTADDVGRAAVHERQIIEAHIVVANGGIAPLRAQLNTIHTQLNNVQMNVTNMHDLVNKIQDKVDRNGARLQTVLKDLAVIKDNGAENGSIFPFVVVPFDDGTDPTREPNLPAYQHRRHKHTVGCNA